jgi:NAD(P)-dependent dehydrogenase (short-subunit alcohol dehydrogenase family)
MKLSISRPYILGTVVAGCAVAMLLRNRTRFDWNRKVVLITGGTRGLGMGLARALVQRGARVAVCARDEAELRKAEAHLRNGNGEVAGFQCDVTDAAQVDTFVGAALDRFGHIDCLFNNAGVIQVGPYHTMTLEDFESAMNVIYWGTVYSTLAVLPHMLQRRQGRIVNITSIGGKVSVPHLLPYSCAKFATVAFSEGLRSELCGSGVTTVTIAPGLMRTGSFLKSRFKGDDEREAAWFSASASLPGMSISARRAVNQIICAAARGKAEKILGAPAQFLALFHGVFPGLTADLLGAVNRLLPDGHGPESRVIEPHILKSKLLKSLTLLGRRAADVYLQEVHNSVGV